MSYYDSTWYCNFGNGTSTGYYAVTAWATGATIAAGALRRQLTAPAVGNERVFVAIVAGTTHATTEPTWALTRGAKTTDNTVTWQEVTGASAVNGDLSNTAELDSGQGDRNAYAWGDHQAQQRRFLSNLYDGRNTRRFGAAHSATRPA